MSPDLKSLGIDQMTVDERLKLIDAIWNTFPEGPPLSPAHQLELDRRLDEIESGEAKLIPAEQVKAELEARYGS